MSPEQTYTLKARITLLDTKSGGRKNPVYSGYRPSFGFTGTIQYDGEIRLIGTHELKPGQSSNVMIRLVPVNTITIGLKNNDFFTINERNRAIGTGVIEDVKVEY
jgi:translation elongation factor EF-Tu-like GTPase